MNICRTNSLDIDSHRLEWINITKSLFHVPCEAMLSIHIDLPSVFLKCINFAVAPQRLITVWYGHCLYGQKELFYHLLCQHICSYRSCKLCSGKQFASYSYPYIR